MILKMELPGESYDIVIEKGCLLRAGEYLNLKRRVLVVTDTGVPAEYAQRVCDMADEGYICRVEQGEQNKNLDTWQSILAALSQNGFTRSDCVVAVGGGVIGDMAGFAAACYMRGIDFYNIPTTLLSQIDSSIGGKTAVDFMGYKNIVGAFYQPKCVLIDTTLTRTLSRRQRVNGIVEAVKMAATSSEQLFKIFETQNFDDCLDEIIVKSLEIKRDVVINDVREGGLRRILNFGHTIGHAIESMEGLSGLLHGECVALGMLKMARGEAKERIYRVLSALGLPLDKSFDKEQIMKAIAHDKKAAGSDINLVFVDSIGSYRMEKMSLDAFGAEMED